MFEDFLRKILDTLAVLWRPVLSGFLVIACGAISWGGVDYAAYRTHCDSDGGRGGALAVILAVLVIFFTPSHASRLYRILSEGKAKNNKAGDNNTVLIVRHEISNLLDLLEGDAKYLTIQNIFLFFASAVGTFFWGFGDLFAKAILKNHGLPPCAQ